MAFRTIESIVDIAEDRRVIVQLPSDVPVGKHRMVTMLDETLANSNGTSSVWKFPILEGTTWPAGMTWRREDLYAE